ncbi:hypothetical protein ACTJJ7_11320 [Phyllobacterium sp. 22229]|uniref:Uncharacterized protein n=1 Tax=Agrobacterium radiobacter TaxID=362 RepID=A0ABD5LKS6_AGRRD
MRFREYFLCGAVGFSAMVSSSQAKEVEFDHTKLDLAKLIECRATVPEYSRLGAWLKMEPQALEKLGWQQADSGNPFIEQYRLDKPVAVFATQTRDVAFAGYGLLAVLDHDAEHDLARELDVPTLFDQSGRFERVIAEGTDDSNALIAVKTRVSLQISTFESHPGKIFAGCSYSFSLEVQE